MINIFITGGSGYLGRSILYHLNKFGKYSLTSFSRNKPKSTLQNIKYVCGDILNKKSLLSAMKGSNIVIHLAGGGGEGKCLSSPMEHTQINLIGLNNIIETSKNYGIKNIIFASSIYVYTSYAKADLPIDEKMNREPDSFYGTLKYLGEEIIRNSGLNFTIFRFSNIYGSINDIEMPMGAMGHFLKAIEKNKNIKIFGRGRNIIDYVHIKDVVNVFELSLNKKFKNKFYNIAGNEPIILIDLAKLIIEIAQQVGLRYKKNIKYLELSDKNFSDLWLSIKKTKNELGWSPKINLRTGIKNHFDHIIHKSQK